MDAVGPPPSRSVLRTRTCMAAQRYASWEGTDAPPSDGCGNLSGHRVEGSAVTEQDGQESPSAEPLGAIRAWKARVCSEPRSSTEPTGNRWPCGQQKVYTRLFAMSSGYLFRDRKRKSDGRALGCAVVVAFVSFEKKLADTVSGMAPPHVAIVPKQPCDGDQPIFRRTEGMSDHPSRVSNVHPHTPIPREGGVELEVAKSGYPSSPRRYIPPSPVSASSDVCRSGSRQCRIIIPSPCDREEYDEEQCALR